MPIIGALAALAAQALPLVKGALTGAATAEAAKAVEKIAGKGVRIPEKNYTGRGIRISEN